MQHRPSAASVPPGCVEIQVRPASPECQRTLDRDAADAARLIHALELADQIAVEAELQRLPDARILLRQCLERRGVIGAAADLVGDANGGRSRLAGKKAHLAEEVARAADADDGARLLDAGRAARDEHQLR